MSYYGAIVTGDAAALAKSKFDELKHQVEEGNIIWRMMGAGAGAGLLLISIISIPLHILSPFTLVMDLYVMAFGALAVCLEYKEHLFGTLLPSSYLEAIRREALCLYRPYGRACFYFFVGIMIVTQNSIFSLSFMVGVYVATMGAIIFLSSRSALSSMAALRAQGLGEADIRNKFNRADKDKNGTLDTTELAALCSDLGTTLSRNELEAALVTLDKNGDGAISYDEFVFWYYGRD